MGAGVVRFTVQHAPAQGLGLLGVAAFDVQLGDEQIGGRVGCSRSIPGRRGAGRRRLSPPSRSVLSRQTRAGRASAVRGVERLGPPQAGVGVGGEPVGQQHLAQPSPGLAEQRLAQHRRPRRRRPPPPPPGRPRPGPRPAALSARGRRPGPTTTRRPPPAARARTASPTTARQRPGSATPPSDRRCRRSSAPPLRRRGPALALPQHHQPIHQPIRRAAHELLAQPSGQCTSTQSTAAAEPRPNKARGSPLHR